jgi:uncharacterized protein (DUF2267 family)
LLQGHSRLPIEIGRDRHTVQETNVWLKKLTEDHHLGHHAYIALRAVLHVLRDRLTPEQAVHLGAQLPILVRGIYYEGWRLAAKPADEPTNSRRWSPPNCRRSFPRTL